MRSLTKLGLRPKSAKLLVRAVDVVTPMPEQVRYELNLNFKRSSNIQFYDTTLYMDGT